MLVERRKRVVELGDNKLLEMADILCHGMPIVRPIFECVKVFVRLHKQNVFTYARHPLDLGTQLITADQISSRMNDPLRERIVLEALSTMEESCKELWPFAPGSSSWVLLEVLHPNILINGKQNAPTIIFRKATRLSFEGAHSSTPLIEGMFNKLKSNIEKQDMLVAGFSFRVDPTVELNNVSGTGVFTKLFSEDKAYDKEAKSEFVDELLECNFDIPLHQNPGFYFSFEGEVYSVRSDKFQSSSKSSKKKSALPPLPISGFIK
jgi:hypothetical protein